MKFRRSALEFLVPRRVGFLSVCRIFTFSCAALLSLVCRCHAAELTDVNGDGQIMVLAFGDSITAGVGSSFGPSDFVETVEGAAISTSYPALLSGLLSVRVANSGIPGEEFTSEGFYRFVDEVRQNAADAVVFLEGANDAVFLVSSNEYQEKLQKLINAMHVLGVQFVALTQTVPCCDHSSLEPFTRDFSSRVRLLGALNDIDVVDVERAWDMRCPDSAQCPLINRPEGLHPNRRGYEFIAQQVAEGFGFEVSVETPTPTPSQEGENSESMSS